MKVKQAKLASALRGETSNIIDCDKYDLNFDKGMLHANLKFNQKNIGPFIIFPANIAYLEYEVEQMDGPVKVTASTVQEQEQTITKDAKAKVTKK